jgi:hypothetical protein
LPKGVKISEYGNAEFKIRERVKVTILPDQVGITSNGSGAETRIQFNGVEIPGCEFDSQDRITKIDSLPPIEVIIQTTYRPDLSSDDTSAYGRGTTEQDVKAGNTSLKFHEGSHGSDFIKYLKAHPTPQFKGRVGMTKEQFQQSKDNYIDLFEKYQTSLDSYSKAQTDCVGKKAQSCQ